MRYTDTGEVHKDFHLATNATIDFVLSEYGIDFLKELFGRTAKNVYKDIYENLQKGDHKPLLEHWKYYYTREQGVFSVSERDGGFTFHVTECPACRHLKEKNTPITDNYYLQISLLNEAWAENTPFTIETHIISEGEYKMRVQKRRIQDDSQ
jgi:hypothetical protein